MLRINKIIFLFAITFLFSNNKDFTDAFIDVSKKTNPAVVSIISQKEVVVNNPFQSHPFFQTFLLYHILLTNHLQEYH